MSDLVTLLRDAAYLAFEDGTNDYTTADKAANELEAQAARIAELEAKMKEMKDNCCGGVALDIQQIARQHRGTGSGAEFLCKIGKLSSAYLRKRLGLSG